MSFKETFIKSFRKRYDNDRDKERFIAATSPYVVANLLRTISAKSLIQIDEKGKVWRITDAGMHELSR